MPQSTELNILDELYLHLDRAEEPWSVHVEVRVSGSLDPERLEQAVHAAAALHPIARASLRDRRPTDRRYHWEVAERLEEAPLAVFDGGLEVQRERLLATSPALEAPPPFELSLVRSGDGDSLLLNLHHAAGDGMGAVRLLASILRAYGGEDDPAPPVDPLAVRDIDEITRPSIGDRVKRIRALTEHLARLATPQARVAGRGGTDHLPPYGFELIHLDADETQAVVARRRDGATANDVLLAAIAVAIRRWNDDAGADRGRIALMMPVNLRPAEWRFDVVGNYASYVTVHVSEDSQSSFDAALAATHEATRRIKDDQIAGLIVDLLQFPTALPTGVKQQLQELIPLTGNFVVDTAVLSNLGRLEQLPRLDEAAGEIKELWFSPPGRMPLGASFGAATVHGELFLTLRYRRALFDADAAREFGQLVREAVVGD